MKIYDERGRHIGDLIEDNGLSGAAAAVAVVLIIGTILSVVLMKYIGENGYAFATSLTYGACIFLWIKYLIPDTMDNCNTVFGGIIANIITGLLYIPVLAFFVLFCSEISCSVILGNGFFI